ncbi:chromate transporter [Paenibacillus cremeus]|uniref:Chromate transporter n=1 Tax=Paenibacillus cremeus TaxID=2163881 RepID=A0A559K0U6_9BACL|nr:chromate transporter [Paenibacillus cremeus]TVY05670.1 chromate transporter [Paenibacillus cremeus]
MSTKTYKELTIGMARAGVLGFGGGPSVIPLIRYEAVTKYQWMDDNEFGEILAIANTLPGPIAPKMAAYCGYRLNKTMGAVVAVLAHILPTSLAMIALLGFLYMLQHSPVVAGMIAAVRPVIAVMLGQMAYEFAAKSVKGLGKLGALIFGVIAFVLLSVLDVHPGIVVAIALLYGAFHFRLMASRSKAKDAAAQKGASA